MSGATPQSGGRVFWRLRDGARRSGVRVRQFARDPVAQFRRNVEQLPFDYPVSTVVLIDVVLLVVSTAALIQRFSYFPSVVPVLAVVLTYLNGPLYAFLGLSPKPWLMALLTMSATALFMSQPVDVDVAPFILICAAGEIAAITPLLISVVVAAAMAAEVALFAVLGNFETGTPPYLVGILCGWMAGRALQAQTKYLNQERAYQDIRTSQATDEERRRIAREVHDVIAHSLSITLLHVTAARHALQTDRDVDDAVDALTDAERLGRQAMADIRRTVGLLDQRPAPQTPEPGLDDLGDLIADFVGAGMEVDFRVDGDICGVSPGLGLALYRISQESLANVAKHAPGASARLRIEVSARDIAVTVTNTLPTGAAQRPGRGMGISGMRQRARMHGGGLSAGPCEDGWQVQARIPFSGQPIDCAATAAEDSVWSMIHSMKRKRQESRTEPASTPQTPRESV